ncbi:MAG: hypothetical protein JWN15_451 [Firmicutes bacterium]|nr:hypothetical protein [Bacillota bacterium]
MAVPYNRSQAVRYAARWWAGYNPAFSAFLDDDCTNFVSQCLFAGGMPMAFTGRRDRGWWYRGPREQWSYSWAVANSLRRYLPSSGRAQERDAARQLLPGDVIAYDWDGDGVWQHTSLVIGYDRSGEPLVAAHTPPTWAHPWPFPHRPKRTSRTKVGFLHINLP